MKAIEILGKIIELMQKNLRISVYKTFSSNIVAIPITEQFLTIAISSGCEDKTLLKITAYTPQEKGAEMCRQLTENTINVLHSSNLENLSDVVMYDVEYDKQKRAYVQKFKITFLQDTKILTQLTFGDIKIFAEEDFVLKFKRRIQKYFSVNNGAYIDNVAKEPTEAEGTASISDETFSKLLDMFEKGKRAKLKVKDKSFNACLINMIRKNNHRVYFKFMEVTA